MRSTRTVALVGLVACLTSRVTTEASDFGHVLANHQSRTYFGPPGTGPYGPVNRPPKHPWTAQVFGHRCCVTPEEQYERFLQKYQIAEARFQADINRLNWTAYKNYMERPYGGYPVGPAPCNCGRGAPGPTGTTALPESHFHKCGKCGHFHHDHAACKVHSAPCASGNCGGEGHYPSLLGWIKHKNKGCATCGGDGGDGVIVEDGGAGYVGGGHPWHHHHGVPYSGNAQHTTPPFMHPGYPAMNPEDALRYVEGFQYYPPHHLIRSPRDFFMFDVKYGAGRK